MYVFMSFESGKRVILLIFKGKILDLDNKYIDLLYGR